MNLRWLWIAVILSGCMGNQVYAVLSTIPAKDTSTDTSKSISLNDPILFSAVTVTEDTTPVFYYDTKGRPDPMDLPWLMKTDIPIIEIHKPVIKKVLPKKIIVNPQDILQQNLQGIIYADYSPAAGSLVILNGQYGKTGQVLNIPGLPNPVKIELIRKSEVVIQYQKKRYTIKLANSL
jgi:hypothetical protein